MTGAATCAAEYEKRVKHDELSPEWHNLEHKMCRLLPVCTPISRSEGRLRDAVLVAVRVVERTPPFAPKRSAKPQQRQQTDAALQDDAFKDGLEHLEQPSQRGRRGQHKDSMHDGRDVHRRDQLEEPTST